MRLGDIVYFGITKTLNLEVLRINFEKAFNSTNRNFLVWVLEKLVLEGIL